MQFKLHLTVTNPDSLSVPRQSVVSAFQQIIDNGCHDADDALMHDDSDQGKIFKGLSTGYRNDLPLTIDYSVE